MLHIPLTSLHRRNDYLLVALVLSLAVHGLALALRFVPPTMPEQAQKPLEVVLINTRSPVEPLQPQVLAQYASDGGGETESGLASTPLPVTTDQPADEVVLAALRKRQEELEAEQQRLYTQLISEEQMTPARDRPDHDAQSQDPGTDTLHQEQLVLNAQIGAIKERIERYNARPRRQFVGPMAKSADYADYVEAWRQKVELLGTEHYPQEARGRVYGSLQLTVYIRRDGSLEKVEIDRPSEHAILNLAARRIVHLASPFAPLPPAIAAHTDVLAITRTWNFVNQQLETHLP